MSSGAVLALVIPLVVLIAVLGPTVALIRRARARTGYLPKYGYTLIVVIALVGLGLSLAAIIVSMVSG